MSDLDSPLPKFFRVRQDFPSHAIDDVQQATRSALEQSGVSTQIKKGETVGIAVGSRGIANLSTIVGATADYLKSIGAAPFIVPAMGSHGGATAEGQARMLASFGVDESSVGCPIRSSMETVSAGTTSDGIEVHFDKIASEADHVIIVNRVKPHTRLSGRIESGIIKMMMIGLGKHSGAKLYHQVFPRYDYCLDRLAEPIVEMLLERMPIRLGIGIVEDAHEQTSLVQAIRAEQLVAEEPRLLALAKQRMPRLPFDIADLLIVDSIGKEISGTGMDTNVIGRKQNDKVAGPEEFPKIRHVYVRSLTKTTAGNACGIGLAEYCHANVVKEMNADVTRINCITSAHPTAGAVPLTFESDREVLAAVVSQFGTDRIPDLRWMWICDTLRISELLCSGAYYEEAKERDDLQVLSEPETLRFDEQSDLIQV